MKVSYKIIPGNGLPRNGPNDDYVGIEIFIDDEIKTTFTGFLDGEALEYLLTGRAEKL